MTGQIFSPGKLLLTSEYTVLDGALALALPTKWGQEFFFEEHSDNKTLITWEAYHQNKLWLTAVINYESWEVVECNNLLATQFIVNVLKNVQTLSSKKLLGNCSYHVKTNLQFPSNFGLGSSSTLMNNLAVWADLNAYQLNELCLGGSGYDIAVAKENSALLYQLLDNERRIETINFAPKFKEEIIFIHLNQKQDSREGINMYRSKVKLPQLIQEFSELTKQVLKCEGLEEFSKIMELHEQKLSNFLLINTVKEKYFSDCSVFVKSLGAWGGDFVMSCKFSGFQDYFSERGFSTVFEWNEIIA